MHLGAGLLQCAGLEQKVGLPAPFAQGRVARRLNSTAPDPMPRSSTTATRSPTGDEVEPVSWFRLSAVGAVCSRLREREAPGSFELAGSFEFAGLDEARLLLGATPGGALGDAAASAGLGAGAGVRGGVGTGVVAGREAAAGSVAGAGVRVGAASSGRAAASPAAEIGTTAESQPPPTESDGLLAASAGGGGTRGAGASESLRFRENDQPCTEPGGGKIFPAPKLL